MMATKIDVVKAFVAGLSKGSDEMMDTIRRYFTPDTVYENVGMMTTRGIEEAIDVMKQMEDNMGVELLDIKVLAIAMDGNTVLTERLDRMLKLNGSEVGCFRVMGAFEVENDRILAWRDYFDTAGTLAMMQKA
jgi:limonene-1,2-epoxide hydrolase